MPLEGSKVPFVGSSEAMIADVNVEGERYCWVVADLDSCDLMMVVLKIKELVAHAQTSQCGIICACKGNRSCCEAVYQLELNGITIRLIFVRGRIPENRELR